MYLVRGSQDPVPRLHYCFFLCFSLISTTLPFRDEQLFEPACWNSEKVKQVEWSLFPIIKEMGTEKGFCAQEPRNVPLGVRRNALFITKGHGQPAGGPPPVPPLWLPESWLPAGTVKQGPAEPILISATETLSWPSLFLPLPACHLPASAPFLWLCFSFLPMCASVSGL